jgi:hypothetical protein
MHHPNRVAQIMTATALELRAKFEKSRAGKHAVSKADRPVRAVHAYVPISARRASMVDVRVIVVASAGTCRPAAADGPRGKLPCGDLAV